MIVSTNINRKQMFRYLQLWEGGLGELKRKIHFF